MTTKYDKNKCPATPRYIHLAHSEKFMSACKKMNEISNFYYNDGEILIKDADGENLVMFNIMGRNNKTIQSFVWDENKSTIAQPAFHDWTKMMQERG